MTPEQAVNEVRTRFPFANYIIGDLAPWLSVGHVAERYGSPGARLFDLGAGACDKTAVAQLLGWNCVAVDDLQDDWYLRGDNIVQIQDFARSMGVQLSREFVAPEAETYDMVMMNDVLEHIHDSPRELLTDLVNGLKTGGHLFITVPNLANVRKRLDLLRGRTNLAQFDMYYWYQGPWRGPQREYVRGDLESLCRNLGVDVVELGTVHHMLGNLPTWAHSPYKAITAVMQDWRDTWLLVAKKPADWKPKRSIPDEEFAKIYGTKSNESLYSGANA